MPQQSIVPALQAALDTYVERKERDWELRQEGLPATNDGKINATGVIEEMRSMGLKLVRGTGWVGAKPLEHHHVQHLHRKPELVVRLNALGRRQNLKPLGSRSVLDTAEVQESLAELLNEWQATYLDQGAPTLPMNPAGKVCLSAIAGQLAARLPGLEKSAIFRALHQEELASEIGLIADQQGVRLPAEALSPGDEALRQRMAQQAKAAARDARAATASRLSEAKLREELAIAQQKIQRLEAQVESLNTQMGLMRSGIVIRGL